MERQPVARRPGVAQLEKKRAGESSAAPQPRRRIGPRVGLHKSPCQQDDRAEARARPPVLKAEACVNQLQPASSGSLITGS